MKKGKDVGEGCKVRPGLVPNILIFEKYSMNLNKKEETGGRSHTNIIGIFLRESN